MTNSQAQCQGPGCRNEIVQLRTGRPRKFCSQPCRQRHHEAARRERDHALWVQSREDKLTELRRLLEPLTKDDRARVVTLATDLGSFTATRCLL